MWNRVDLKNNAKAILRKHYWPAVLVAIILGISNGGRSISPNSFNINRYIDNDTAFSNFFDSFNDLQFANIFMLLGIGITFFLGFSLFLSIFLFNPLKVGCKRWLLKARTDEIDYGNIVFAFKNGYGNVVKVKFFISLYIFLWSLLCIVPGIIKTYEYRLIPYLLAENPNMEMNEAFARSKQLMDGQKLDTFILDLSFIGWIFATMFTCGMVGLFYVSPYRALTDMELYVALCTGNNTDSNTYQHNEQDLNNDFYNSNWNDNYKE